MTIFVTVLSVILQVFSLSIGIYYLIIGIFGFIPLREKTKKNGGKYHRFALVTAAYNEEAVIGALIDSMKQLDYPKEAYDIFVVADNCTDHTAAVAREHGAVVMERFNTEKRGKGSALEWIFKKIFSLERKYDYICIFDADNLVDGQYLREINRMANRGYRVIQGYIDSKNPFDSWITSAYSLAGWSLNRIFQLPRFRLGMCCQLNGTGFAMSCGLLQKIGWGASCLTEDMEFTMKLAMHDERVAWAHNAVVYDEKPLHLMESWRQRRRWMQGHCDVAARYWGKLMKKAFRERKLAPFDCAVYLLQPIRVIAMGVIMFFAYAQSFYPEGDLGFVQLSYIFKSPVVWNIITLIQFLYLPFVITYERRELDFHYILAYLLYPFYNLTWIPIAVQGLLGRKKTQWYHTRHTRTASIHDMKKRKAVQR